MVQICCACNDKNANQAEGGTANSIDGRFTPSDNKSIANSESSIVRFRVSHKHRHSVSSDPILSKLITRGVSKLISSADPNSTAL